MSILGVAVLGFVFTATIIALTPLWDKIKIWLNGHAANIVEKMFGYKARKNIYQAISKIDRLVDKIRQTSVIYTKEKPWDNFYHKVEITTTIDESELDYKILDILNTEKSVEQKFEYKR